MERHRNRVAQLREDIGEKPVVWHSAAEIHQALLAATYHFPVIVENPQRGGVEHLQHLLLPWHAGIGSYHAAQFFPCHPFGFGSDERWVYAGFFYKIACY